jgi:hypothetical protein
VWLTPGRMMRTYGPAEGSTQPLLHAWRVWVNVNAIRCDNPQGFFKGILHEMAHAAFWATHGAGFDYAERKAGIMAVGSPAGIWLTEVDVSSVLAFTRGKNRVKQ